MAQTLITGTFGRPTSGRLNLAEPNSWRTRLNGCLLVILASSVFEHF